LEKQKEAQKKPGRELRADFMYLHISNTTKSEYAIYLRPVPKMGYQQSAWVISHLGDVDDKNPTIYYCCEQTTGNIPPESGWKVVDGPEPAPTLQIEFLNNPVHKGHPSAELEPNKLEEALWGHTTVKDSNQDHSVNLKHANVQYQSKALSKPHLIIQQPRTSDMKREVNEYK